MIPVPTPETRFLLIALPVGSTIMSFASFGLGMMLGSSQALVFGLAALFLVAGVWGSAGVSLVTGFFYHRGPLEPWPTLRHRLELPGTFAMNIGAALVLPVLLMLVALGALRS